MFEIDSVFNDHVIRSKVGTGFTTYGSALKNIFPLADRFDAQRKFQNKKFYQRLQRDIIRGCLMPPITIAFVDNNKTNLEDKQNFKEYVNKNIENGYILDGLQRLNTLNAASNIDGFDEEKPILVNIIVAPSQDRLLYRMITLNNGQKPMTARHQIEILTGSLFDFGHLENITVLSEKESEEKRIRGALRLGDISKAYMAFLANNVNNENTKIIEEKMDEILVNRVLDADDDENELNYSQIITIVDKLSENPKVKNWFKVNNNLIGFSVGIRSSYDKIKSVSSDDFAVHLETFENAFDAIDVSKVNLGRERRRFSKIFIEKFDDVAALDSDDLLEYFIEITS